MIGWEGSTVVILASGPSLTAEDAELVRRWVWNAPPNRRAIAINTTFRLAWWADVIYACDRQWWDVYLDEVRSRCDSALWSIEQPNLPAGIETVKAAPRWTLGLGRTPGVIHTGTNSGYQAINLAWQWGASRVVLLGFDIKAHNGRHHHHGPHPAKLDRDNPYELWVKRFDGLAADLRDDPMRVVNCTPRSALRCFPTAALADELRDEPIEAAA